MTSKPPFINGEPPYPYPYAQPDHVSQQQTLSGQPDHISQQQTLSAPAVAFPTAPPMTPDESFLLPVRPARRRKLLRLIPFILAFVLLVAILSIWLWPSNMATSASSPSITQQNFGQSPSSTSTNTTNSTSSGSIRVYIVGAVKHPGVYTLATDARVYDLVQAAGGALAKADLVALNLAAKLTDGEEVYVTVVGEIPPTYMGGVPGPGSGTPTSSTSGQLVNINTASVDELRQSLHLSSTTAQNIVNFRSQHGPYTSVDQLLQVVSRSIYDKIKGLVTVS